MMALGPDRLYVDCTFGRGGHTKHILSMLSASGLVKAFDIDPSAVQAGKVLEGHDGRFEILHAPFGDLGSRVHEPIAGILLDLGVSSPQLDDARRGFSLKNKKDGPLDFRMNQQVGIPASEWLQAVSASQLAWVISSVGYRMDPLLVERIAESILRGQQRVSCFSLTSQFARFLQELDQDFQDEHPGLNLTKLVFYAIRVFLNREMEQLQRVLEAAFQLLEPFGRCVIITFNRWESVAVRRFLRAHEEPPRTATEISPSAALPPTSDNNSNNNNTPSSEKKQRLAELYPLLGSDGAFAVRRTARPAKPTPEELHKNQRSHSSMLHVLEKVPRSVC
ncbi:unnamed protein product [Polarella glacialis]|nr:unnamed protein product [Polarella glacialis]